MSKKENETNENMTKSQAKREARKKEVKVAKRKDLIGKITGYVIAVLLVALIGWLIGLFVVKAMNKVTPIEDFSAGLEANGYISGVNASDSIELPDYKNITVPASEVEYTDAEVDASIESYRNANKEMSTEEGLKVKDGDTVNIAYTGTVDGEEFEGGSSDSYDLTIGSGAFIEGFEEQLIDADNLSTFNINVTFPEDYNEESLAGKDAVFNVTINGIYVLPEFNDEYVAEHLSENASTVEEYRQYLKDTNHASRVRTYVENYLKENSTVKNVDKKYIKTLKGVEKFEEKQNFDYTSMMYKQYLGYDYYTSFEDYIGMSEEEYDKSLIEKSQDAYKEKLIYQAIVEKEGAVADAAYYKDFLTKAGNDENYYDNQVELYGEPNVLQKAIKEKALDIVCGLVKEQ
ncbi:MAG: FKBP-type peptidyl-prolyl cis-trans isomerase [Lachnospiraceae bacterium]|nr:FKBP-type peptidyl-prolyl cis-trans isomerase [Lachnospiraceae bacterium]